MITYVNTVLVSNNNSASILTSIPAAGDAANNKGRFILFDVDADPTTVVSNDPTTYLNPYEITANTQRFKIGMVTGKTIKDIKGVSHTEIKWSNIIQTADVKSVSKLVYPVSGANTEDTVIINFGGITNEVVEELAKGGKRIIVRLTFKDLPTRYRKWTESYEYITEKTAIASDTDRTNFKKKIASDIAALINKQWKRARVEVASGAYVAGVANTSLSDVNTGVAGAAIKIVAMPYDDDNSVDSLNWANKVRFNANCYWTDPNAEGWASLNKMFPLGLTIEKHPGFQYAADAKLVRDREAQAMGYEGILNRGEGTWPVIKPAINTDLDGKYSAITIEFENMYRAADDIFRKTKQSVEIYANSGSTTTNSISLINSIYTNILTALGKNDRKLVDDKTEDGAKD